MNRLILAISDNHIIGSRGKLPWNLPYDLINFKRLTYNSTVVMGRKTFDSLPEPRLPGRNLVPVSADPDFYLCTKGSMPSYESAKAVTCSQPLVNWIGGRSCFEFALPFVEEIVLTRVHMIAIGDVSYYLDPVLCAFSRTSAENREDNGIKFTIETWKKSLDQRKKTK